MAGGAAYVAALSRSSLAATAMARHISAIRSFLRFCQAQGILPQSPLDALKRSRVAPVVTYT